MYIFSLTFYLQYLCNTDIQLSSKVLKLTYSSLLFHLHSQRLVVINILTRPLVSICVFYTMLLKEGMGYALSTMDTVFHFSE